MSIGKAEQKAIVIHDNFFNLVLCHIWLSYMGIYYFCAYKYLFATLEYKKMNPIKSQFWYILQKEIANRKNNK